MANYHHDTDKNTGPSSQVPLLPHREDNQNQESDGTHQAVDKDRLAITSGNILDRADTYIYAIVGICFLIGAIFALIYTFWAFGIAVFINVPKTAAALQPISLAQAIIDFISGLLLVLIILEVLGTVTHFLKSHETSLRPFLFIGIVSATRSILSISARLSVNPLQGADFVNAMIELGVSAFVILALGITLKLLGPLVDDGASRM